MDPIPPCLGLSFGPKTATAVETMGVCIPLSILKRLVAYFLGLASSNGVGGSDHHYERHRAS